MDDQKLMAIAPSGAARLSSQNIKLLLAHKSNLRQHLLDGLGLCYIACLPQSTLAHTSQLSAPSQGQTTLPAALTTNSGSNNHVAGMPMSPTLGLGNPHPQGSAAKAALVADAEEAVQQIEEELEEVIRVALESAPKDKVVCALPCYSFFFKQLQPSYLKKLADGLCFSCHPGTCHCSLYAGMTLLHYCPGLKSPATFAAVQMHCKADVRMHQHHKLADEYYLQVLFSLQGSALQGAEWLYSPSQFLNASPSCAGRHVDVTVCNHAAPGLSGLVSCWRSHEWCQVETAKSRNGPEPAC